MEGVAVAEWLSSWLAEQEDRNSIPGLAAFCAALIIFLLYVPKTYFSCVNIGKLAESSLTKLPFQCVSL